MRPPLQRSRHWLPSALHRRFEALVLDWDAATRDGRTDPGRLRRRIEALCAAGADVFIVSAGQIRDMDGHLAVPGRLYLCVRTGSEVFLVDGAGPHLVSRGRADTSDHGRWIFSDLWRRGIGPSQVLIVGDEASSAGGSLRTQLLLGAPEAARATAVSIGAEPTGLRVSDVRLRWTHASFLMVLEDQLRRRRRRELPEIEADPAWTLAVHGFDPELERAHEALLTLADGTIGTSGAPMDSHPAASPRVLAAGLYRGEGSESQLLPCPLWNRSGLALPAGGKLRRTLDLRTGVLLEESRFGRARRRSLLLSSAARPGTVALRSRGTGTQLPTGPPLQTAGPEPCETGKTGGRTWMVAEGVGGVCAAATDSGHPGGLKRGLDRLASYEVDPTEPPPPDEALRRLEQAERLGFEGLLREHREAWAQRWEGADLKVQGDRELTHAVRFALFHLMASATDLGEAVVGARGLAGRGYRGHVFWDSDVFVLPFLAATNPPAARAMLEYRLRRLKAAREAAAAAGRRGARFPWESARDGRDVTPTSIRDQLGRTLPVKTGSLEEHIVADVAWAASCYLCWTGDAEFAAGPGRALLIETARYWTSRASMDSEGRAHIRQVMGPDEYHPAVDDNAFTNVMARWNLRRAAEVVAGEAALADESAGWRRLGGSLIDGYNAGSGLYEQFDGFYGLEPLVINDVARQRPVAADVLLGTERVREAQVVKQADVLMLHYLLPDEVAPGSLLANLDFYEPRTAHGSSLSPGVHAALLARAGRLEEASEMLRLTARIDLEDVTRTTAGGLHLGAMGSLWQALVFGFGGVRALPEALLLDPHLPETFRALEVRLRYRGAKVRLELRKDEISGHADRPVQFSLPDGQQVQTPAGHFAFRLEGDAWSGRTR